MIFNGVGINLNLAEEELYSNEDKNAGQVSPK
jgi:hypothetical protein